tara:strand:+ start:152 stop:367 length:216 start_codon:yes stop_codon:yes gene_type:complete
MSKFEYVVLEGWENLQIFADSIKGNAKIKKIKSNKKLGPKSKLLNIMGQEGWELISTPIMGAQTLIFKKKI